LKPLPSLATAVQRLVQSGFCEVAITSTLNGYTVPRDLTEPSRFTNPFPPIRLLRISILHFLRGDFCNNIGTFETSGNVRFSAAVGRRADIPQKN
jgi:hypothetical protein